MQRGAQMLLYPLCRGDAPASPIPRPLEPPSFNASTSEWEPPTFVTPIINHVVSRIAAPLRELLEPRFTEFMGTHAPAAVAGALPSARDLAAGVAAHDTTAPSESTLWGLAVNAAVEFLRPRLSVEEAVALSPDAVADVAVRSVVDLVSRAPAAMSSDALGSPVRGILTPIVAQTAERVLASGDSLSAAVDALAAAWRMAVASAVPALERVLSGALLPASPTVDDQALVRFVDELHTALAPVPSRVLAELSGNDVAGVLRAVALETGLAGPWRAEVAAVVGSVVAEFPPAAQRAVGPAVMAPGHWWAYWTAAVLDDTVPPEYTAAAEAGVGCGLQVQVLKGTHRAARKSLSQTRVRQDLALRWT